MPLKLRLLLVGVSLLLFLILIFILRKGRMPIKYSLVWFYNSVYYDYCGIYNYIINYWSSFNYNDIYSK